MALFKQIKVLSNIRHFSIRNSSSLTLVSEDKGIRRITLNNPSKRNALSSTMLEKLHKDIFDDLDDTKLRCILVQSTGPAFSSGHDLKELIEAKGEKRGAIFQKCSDLMMGLQTVPVPVIAVVNGVAAAAGCQLVASCDISIASSKSQFSTPGASVGLFCSTPGVAVSRNVPLKMASYMLLTGNTLTATEAQQCGLISKVVEEADLETTVEAVIESILSKSRTVLSLGKKFFYDQLHESIDEAYNIASNVMVKNLSHNDAEEGIKAFFEKRKPNWKHS